MRIDGVKSQFPKGQFHGRDSFLTKFRMDPSPRGLGRKPSPMVSVFFFLLFILISAALTGCTTQAKIQNVMLPFVTVKKIVIGRLPMATVKEESLNGRELTSNYFNPKNFDEDATDRSERAYAKVVILGAGRPYSVDVHVFREKKNKSGKYSLVGEDRKLTKELIVRIREALADRRDDRNFIDDFRAF